MTAKVVCPSLTLTATGESSGLMAQYAFSHHPAQWWCDQTTYDGHAYPNTFYWQ